MNRWLMDHFEGEWYGTHHQWQVPEEAKDYLIFTIVRNPYEQAVSGWFMVPWIDPPKDRPKPVNFFGEEMRDTIRRKQSHTESDASNNPPPMTQKDFVDKAGISLVLYHEWLPECLKALPFVDSNNVAPFPHIEESGKRPSGTFFDIFTAEDEKLVWEYFYDDFETFGYHRFDPDGLDYSHKWLRQPNSR